MKNNNKGKISIPLVLIFGTLGAVLIFYGVKHIIKLQGFKETPGTYLESIQYTTKDNDDRPIILYKWVYEYYVDGALYKMTFGGNNTRVPKNTEDIILYNPNNPSDSFLKSNNLGVTAICFGLIFAFAPFLAHIVNGRSKKGFTYKTQIYMKNEDINDASPISEIRNNGEYGYDDKNDNMKKW